MHGQADGVALCPIHAHAQAPRQACIKYGGRGYRLQFAAPKEKEAY